MTSTKKIKSINGISESQYLTINDSEQYVLIRGENMNNPILLLLHGGPGASATAMFRKYNSDLERNFIVVYWDQRNAGKSYKKDFPAEEIKVQNYVQDAYFLVSYLKNRFDKKKIFLVGHSWGTRLGMYAIRNHPENFYAYVGVSQEISSFEGESISYQYTLNKAKELNKVKLVKKLEEIGAPQSGDYNKMYRNGYRDFWKQKNWLMKMGGDSYRKLVYLDWMLSTWFSREYSFLDLIKCVKSISFSTKNIVNDPDYHNLDLFKQIPEVKIPVFFISGKYDYNTPWSLVEKYYNNLKAPYKDFIKFEKSGHSPPFEEPERFIEEIIWFFKSVEIE